MNGMISETLRYEALAEGARSLRHCIFYAFATVSLCSGLAELLLLLRGAKRTAGSLFMVVREQNGAMEIFW